MNPDEWMKEAFYGTDDGPTQGEIAMLLYELTGGDGTCAVELVEASNEVERNCPGAALTKMPHWIN